MKILYYFCEDNTYMSKWQRIHIFDELSHHGHSIDVYNPLQYATFEDANEKLIPFILQSHKKYDVFMTCVGSDFIQKETIEDVKKIGLPTLLICFDNLHAPHMHKKIASSFDMVWLTSFETKWMFEKWGCKNITFQTYAANPFRFTPRWGNTIFSVDFIGTPYGSRINKLNALTYSDIPCVVYTDSINNLNSLDFTKIGIEHDVTQLFKNVKDSLCFDIGRKVLFGAIKNKIVNYKQSVLDLNSNLGIKSSVSFDEMQNLYSNHSLSLNITELRNTYVLKNPTHKIHLRTFEIPMCGGLEIASYTDELASYFDDGKEIILYKSKEELISKAKFYLNPKNENTCLRMKHNARKRAESDHTWMNRFKILTSL